MWVEGGTCKKNQFMPTCAGGNPKMAAFSKYSAAFLKLSPTPLPEK